jgi:hypothetical protein
MATKAQAAPHDEHIDTTVETINDHVKSESTTALTSISSWMKTLEAHDEFKGISENLEALKEALKSKDGPTIVSLMEKLGADTTKAGEGAEGGKNTKVVTLGKALTLAAKAIAKLG